MALYKHKEHLTQISDDAFDAKYPPGMPAPHPGIYRCVGKAGCGHEIAIAGGDELPSADHHRHAASQGGSGGEIEWQLLVYPVQKK